jgi:hypothetical protein
MDMSERENEAPIFELCERCGSEGRLYVSDGRDHDGSPRERDLGECPDCKGEGLVCMPGVPRTKWDDFAMFDYFDGALDALCSDPLSQAQGVADTMDRAKQKDS